MSADLYKILSVAIFALVGLGVYFIIASMVRMNTSLNQLKVRKKPKIKSVDKWDTAIVQWINLRDYRKKASKGQIYAQKYLNALEKWSEIGYGKPFEVTATAIKSLIWAIVFTAAFGIFTKTFWICFLGFVVGFAIPTLILRGKFLGVTFKARRKGLLPFIDVYKNAYIQAKENVITAFNKSREDCPEEMKTILQWMLRRIHNGTPQREAIREFAEVMRSGWAQVFANYLISGLEGESENITRALGQLQVEMYSNRDEEEEREVITTGAFYANFVIIVLTIGGIILNCTFLPGVRKFFVQTSEGHALISFTFICWIFMITYSYYVMKGGDQ